MRLMLTAACGLLTILTGCSSKGTSSVSASTKAPALTHKYRPNGDSEVQIDLTKI